MIEFQEAIDRIANRVPVENRLADIVSDTQMFRTGPATTGRTRYLTIVVTAACIALVATAAIVLVARQPDATGDTNPPPPTAVPFGVPEPLLMLPGDSTATSGSGQIAAGKLGELDGPISLIATPSGPDQYTDPFTITVLSRTVELDAAKTSITLSNGPASIVEDAAGAVTILQQRGSQWLLASGFIDRSIAISAIEKSTVGADGLLSLPSETFEILFTETSANGDLVTALFTTNDGLTVETSTVTTPLLNNLAPIRSAARLVVRGHAGWRLTTPGPDGADQNIVRWMETPARSAMVYGIATVETILARANSLKVVDYPTWLRAVGDQSTTGSGSAQSRAEQTRLTEAAQARLAEVTSAAEAERQARLNEAAAKSVADSTP